MEKQEKQRGKSLGLNKKEMVELLQKEVVPALGCTEPVCVALACAAAASLVEGKIKEINLKMNPGLYKNGMAVAIPGFDRVGMTYAGALGAIIGNPQKGLQLLEEITPEISKQAIDMVEKNQVKIKIVPEENLYAEAEVITDHNKGRCIIRGSHDNIVFLAKDGQVIKNQETAAAAGDLLHNKLHDMNIAQIYNLTKEATEQDIGFMLDGIKMNLVVNKFMEENPLGIGIAKSLKKHMANDLLGNNLVSRVMYRVASCAEGRMTGCTYPVMSSAGSGNHGITVTMAIYEIGEYLHTSNLELCQALAFSHLLNVYIKQRTGKLSAMCGCGIAAATSVAATAVYLQGGTLEQIGNAIINMGGNITGMICDGGKVGCALKLATASSAAIMSAELALDGVVIPASNGICAATPEGTIENMGKVSRPGMTETDHVVLQIMLDKENKK